MILIDANIFMYAAGRESLQSEPCKRYLKRLAEAAKPTPAACTDTEVLQEILHRYRSLKLLEIGFQVFDAAANLGIPVLPVTSQAMAEARRLLEQHPTLATRDAVHLGVMREHGIEQVLTYDRGFSQVPWVQRREP